MKQTSFGDEDESVIAVKPMQPLLRGYKRSIAIAPRILHNAQDHLGKTYSVCSFFILNFFTFDVDIFQNKFQF